MASFLNLAIRKGSGLSNASLRGQYNAVFLDTPDGISLPAWLPTVSFDSGSGTASLSTTAAAQGQCVGSVFGAGGHIHKSCTVGSNRQFTLGSDSGGWVRHSDRIARTKLTRTATVQMPGRCPSGDTACFAVQQKQSQACV